MMPRDRVAGLCRDNRDDSQPVAIPKLNGDTATVQQALCPDDRCGPGLDPAATRDMRVITPRTLLLALEACSRELVVVAGESEPLHPPPNLCAILAKLARHGGGVTFVAWERRDERIANGAVVGGERSGIDRDGCGPDVDL